MPDKTFLDSDIVVDKNHEFNLRMDTLQRLDSVFNRPSAPLEYAESPLSITRREQAQPQLTMSIDQAFLSPDRNVRDLAFSTAHKPTLAQQLGVGTEVRTPYEQAKKYLGKEFGYDVQRPDQEDFYYQNVYEQENPIAQALLYNPSRFISRVAVGAGAKFLEGVGYLGSMLTAGFQEGNYWANVADNSFSKFFEEQDQNFKDYVTPVYKQAGFDEKGFFSKLGDWTFWNDSVADGAAFLVSAFIPMGIASKAGLLSKGAGLFGEATSLSRGANVATKFLTGAESWGEAGMWAFNTANESAFEAAGTFKESKQLLKDQRAQGLNNFSDVEIDQEAGKRASSTFLWNMGALAASNAWEMKSIYKPFAKKLEQAGEQSIGKVGFANLQAYVKDQSRFMKDLSFYGKKGLQGTAMEGFWEENIQTAISRTSAGEYQRRGEGLPKEGVRETTGSGLFGIIKQYGKQTAQALQGEDIEAAEAIGTGALIGVLGSTVISKVAPQRTLVRDEATGKITLGERKWLLGERKAQEINTNVRIAEINNAANNFLNFQDVYNEDGSIDQTKLAEKLKSMDEFSSRQELLNQVQDSKVVPQEEVKALHNSLLNTYVTALSKSGKLEQAISSLNNQDALTSEQLQAKGINQAELRRNPQEMAIYMSTVGQLYEDIQNQNIQTSLPKGFTPEQVQAINQSRKDVAYNLKAERFALEPVFQAKQKLIDDRQNTINNIVQRTIAQTTVENNLTNNKAVDYVRAFAKRDHYIELQKDKNAPQFVQDFYQSQIDEANAEVEQLDTLLGDAKPKIKDGKISTRSKLVNQALDAYQELYESQAILQHDQDKNDFIADSFLDPQYGFDNFNDYLNYQKTVAVEEKVPEVEKPKEEKVPKVVTAEEPKVVSPVVEVKAPEVVAPVVQPAPAIVEPSPTPKPIPRTEFSEETYYEEDLTTKPPTGETLTVNKDEQAQVEQDPTPKTGDVNFIDPSNPIAYVSPLKTSNQQTEFGTPLPIDQEVLVKDPYTHAISKFIQDTIGDESITAVLTGDRTEWLIRLPQVTRERIVGTELEQVVLFKRNGKTLLMKDVAPDIASELANLPVIQSFNKTAFQNKREERIDIKVKREKITPKQAEKEYTRDEKESEDARARIRKNPSMEIPITLEPAYSTHGTIPTTEPATVVSRFGNTFNLGIAHSLTNASLISKGFTEGQVVATFPDGSFSVFTKKISEIQPLSDAVSSVLNHQFDKEEDVKTVISALKDLIYTTERRGFIAQKDGDVFRIKYLDYDSQSPTPNPLDQRLNVNHKIFTNNKTLQLFSVVNNKLTTRTFSNQEYKTMIHENVLTSRKKVTTPEGKLFLGMVNPYYTFTFPKTQSKQYQTYKATLSKQVSATQEQKEGTTTAIEDAFNKGKLTSIERTELLKMINDLPLKEVKPVEPPATPEQIAKGHALLGTEYVEAAPAPAATLIASFGEEEVTPVKTKPPTTGISKLKAVTPERALEINRDGALIANERNRQRELISDKEAAKEVKRINKEYETKLKALKASEVAIPAEAKPEVVAPIEVVEQPKTQDAQTLIMSFGEESLESTLNNISDDIILTPPSQSTEASLPSAGFVVPNATVDFQEGEIFTQEDLSPEFIESTLKAVPDGEFRKYTGTDEATYFALAKKGENNIILLNDLGQPISDIKSLLNPEDLKDFESLEQINCK